MKQKILIVTRDLIGPVRNGGIGTACTALAEQFVEEGKEVHILWVPGNWVENHKSGDTIAKWINHYAKEGVSLIPLPNPSQTKYAQEDYYYALSHRVYEWCKDKTYDAIIVHEWAGIGGHLAAGRKQGKVKSPVVTWCHSPSIWHVMGDQLCASPQHMDMDALEMMSIRWADAIVAPSYYLLDWILQRGHNIADKRYIVRNFATKKMLELHSEERPPIGDIKHIIYFGRLERRKGIDLFCNAILPIMEEHKIDVTFLGKNSSIDGTDSLTWLQNRMNGATRPWSVETEKTQPEALDMISQPGTLVVMPSRYENYPYTVMEAMLLGVPFVTCNTGGIPEMVKSDVFMAEATTGSVRQKIEAWLDDSQLCLDQAAEDENNNDDGAPEWTWDQVITRMMDEEEDAVPYVSPMITVVIPHYNRPVILERALESVAAQDYNNIECLVIDDCSTPENLEIAKKLVDKHGEGFKLIKHNENSYLGAARNTGADFSHGEYIVFLDDDNVLDDNALSEFLNAMECSGADIVCSPLRIFRDVPENIVSEYFFTGELTSAFFHNKIGEAMSMWKKEIFESLHFSLERAGHEDWEILVRAALRGFKIFPLVDPVFLYSQAPDGMLLSGDVVKNIRRSMRPWFDEPTVHYSKQLIMEIAFSQSRAVMMLQQQLQNLYQEHGKLVEWAEKQKMGSAAQNRILTPGDLRRGR